MTNFKKVIPLTNSFKKYVEKNFWLTFQLKE